MNSLVSKVIYLFLITAVVSLVGGVYYLWNQQQTLLSTIQGLRQAKSFTEETVPSPSPTSTNIDDDLAVLALQAKIAELEMKLDQLSTSSSNFSSVIETSNPFPNFSKQILYLGSAETTNRSWTGTSLEITLDSADYPENVQVTFEAGLSIIGGEVWARLKNWTTGAVIATSEVSHGSSSIVWKSSPQFQLHPGKNTYVVEIRSSSGEMARMSGARVILE